VGKSRKRKHKNNQLAWELSGKKNKHHIFPQSRGGTWTPRNIIELDTRVHEAFHLIFSNLTFEEASKWLHFVSEQKKLGFELDLRVKNEELDEVINMLLRIEIIKEDEEVKADLQADKKRVVQELNNVINGL
jgi:hypothetical protein